MAASAPPADLAADASALRLPPELVGACVLKTRYAFDPAWELPDGQTGPSRPESRDRAARRAAFVARIRRALTRPVEWAGAEDPSATPGAIPGEPTAAELIAPEPILAEPIPDGAIPHEPISHGPIPDGATAADAERAVAPTWLDDPGIVLVPGEPAPDGTRRYHPVLPVWHKVLDEGREERPVDHRPLPAWLAEPARPLGGVLCTPLEAADPRSAVRRVGVGLRLMQREADFLRLAGAYGQLADAGLAADPPLVGIVGTDCVTRDDDGEHRFVAWLDPFEPVVRTFSRTAVQGWRLRSILERRRHESSFRSLVAGAAAAGEPGPLVEPIAIGECGRCAWQPQCWRGLPADDLSRRLGSGRLDIREVTTLRRHGVRSVADLAATGDDDLHRWYLPEVTHRSDAVYRIQLARRRSVMQVEGRPVERDTAGPIPVPSATVEIDLDLESSASGAVYLWGFRIADPTTHETDSSGDDESGPTAARSGDPGTTGRYVAFSRFVDLTPQAETELAVEALSWLLERLAAEPDTRVYHYSGYEPAVIARLAGRSEHPVLEQARTLAGTAFVDLYELVREHFIGATGLGLKQVAPCAGFHWRDADPGGLNSQRWFRTAVDAEDPAERAAAAQRVLEYNEDDVAATAALRGWLRRQH